jgi:hypothetical protein
LSGLYLVDPIDMKKSFNPSSQLRSYIDKVARGQWIYRCVLVHDRSTGTLVNQHKKALLEEITTQLSMGAESLMEDDKLLLECNLSDIVTTNGEQQEYWLLAIQAARKAGQLHTQARQQRSSRIP